MSLMLIVVMLYGGMDEFHQHFVPGRSVDVYDFLADTIGALIAIVFIVMHYHSTKKKIGRNP